MHQLPEGPPIWRRGTDVLPYGLVIIGVHTPEFAFERVIGNVRRAVASLGVNYPVAIDNSYLTWETTATSNGRPST